MEQTLKDLEAVFRDVLDNDAIVLKEETTAGDIEEWDSLTHIMLISEIEKKFKIKFTSSEITRFKNVGELANSILTKKDFMSDLLSTFKMHHIGCAVKSISDSVKTYTDLLGFKNVSEIYHLKESGINACFIELSTGVYLELIEPSEPESVINNYLKKRITYYHIGYKVKDVDAVVKDLLEKDFKEISSLHSPAFNNRKCVFMYTPDFQMIELIDSD